MRKQEVIVGRVYIFNDEPVRVIRYGGGADYFSVKEANGVPYNYAQPKDLTPPTVEDLQDYISQLSLK